MAYSLVSRFWIRPAKHGWEIFQSSEPINKNERRVSSSDHDRLKIGFRGLSYLSPLSGLIPLIDLIGPN